MLQRSVLRQKWIFPLLLIVATMLTYLPVWHAGFIWDDDGHVTKPVLRSLHGLARIWIEPGASQQYYPIVHSVFWLEHRIWGDAPLGYHLVNVLLHVACALLLVKVLQRLEVPGAWLAAAIFALHPVHVETAAWVTELKNTLSGVCCLAAALFYLDFDRTRKRGSYVWALALFLVGLLSKSVIASLPAALLVVFWWKRGRLSWKKDALPLLPFFVVGIASGLFTGWVEHRFIGASGAEFNFTVVERCLIAGRAVWFYLWKLLWPLNLSFIYPRWQISQAMWWQYLFPLAGMVLAVLLWRWRHKSRAPLAAFLYFAGTLFPALGFVSVFPFRYSFVADHFQYLASIGPIALAAAGLTLGLERWRGARRILFGTLLLAMAVLTWRQCRMYAGMKTLWETTIQRNPECWMAYSNLSVLSLEDGKVDDALVQVQRALALKPDNREAYVNLGNVLSMKGESAAAIAAYQKALEIEPSFALAWNNLGIVLLKADRLEEAIAYFQKAIELKPSLSVAHFYLGHALMLKEKVEDAIAHFRQALETDPDYVACRLSLGAALQQAGRADEAMTQFQKTLEIDPSSSQAHVGLGELLLDKRQARAAIGHFNAVLASVPGDAKARFNLGMALMQVGEVREAIAQWRKAHELAPSNPSAPNQLAWVLATWPEASIRNGPEALELAEQAVKLSGGHDPALLDTLAAAQAECGSFPEALKTIRRALELAHGDELLAADLMGRLALYAAHSRYREPMPAEPRH